MKSTYDTYGNEQRIRISYTCHKKEKETQTDETDETVQIIAFNPIASPYNIATGMTLCLISSIITTASLLAYLTYKFI